MCPGRTFNPSAKATSPAQIINSTNRLVLLRSSTQQRVFFHEHHQTKHFNTMRRSTSYSPYSSPSPSVSPVSSRSSISGDDLDNDVVDLNSPQDVDYILVIGGLGFIGSHTTLELLKEGYNVVVVADAVSDPRSAAHEHSLADVLHAIAEVVTTADMLRAL